MGGGGGEGAADAGGGGGGEAEETAAEKHLVGTGGFLWSGVRTGGGGKKRCLLK
jgi:hypothetical protein